MTYSDFDIKVPPGRNSGEVKSVCPKCSADRKKKMIKCLSVNMGKGVWKCNHCGWTGSLAFGGEKVRKYDVPEWTNITKLDSKIVDWFAARNIKQETLNKFKVTQAQVFMPQVEADRKTICFNYFRKGKLVNIKYRDSEKNFRMYSRAELIFYNLDALEKPQGVTAIESAVIVEGEPDCLALCQETPWRVVSVPNGAAVKNNNLQYLDNCWEWFEGIQKIYIATDADEAGDVLAEELARRLGVERCYRLKFGTHKDANDALNNQFDFKNSLNESKPFPIEGLFHVKDFEEAYFHLKKHGFPAGWKPEGRLGQFITFHPGYTTVITGIPSHGKSEFTDQLVLSLSMKYNLQGTYFTPENKPTELHLMKLVEKVTGVSHSISSDATDRGAIKYLDNHIMWVYPEEDFSLESILNKVREAVIRFGINWWVLDPWNKLEHKKDHNESATDYIGRCLDVIANFNFRNKIHGFIVAHPKKMTVAQDGIHFNVPNLYDISDSAHWYNKADVGIVIHKDNDDSLLKSDVHVQKVKFKYWGEPGTVGYYWNRANGRYTENQSGDQTNWLTREIAAPELLFPSRPLHKLKKDEEVPF